MEKNSNPIPYFLSSEMVTISYEYTNSNGEIVNTDEFSCTKAISIGNNVVTFLIPNIVVENYGIVRAQVKVYEDGYTLLNTSLFKFYVSESLLVGTATDDVEPIFLKAILDSGAPSVSTEGMPGQFYIDTDTDSAYYCSGFVGGGYIWRFVLIDEVGNIDCGLIIDPAI